MSHQHSLPCRLSPRRRKVPATKFHAPAKTAPGKPCKTDGCLTEATGSKHRSTVGNILDIHSRGGQAIVVGHPFHRLVAFRSLSLGGPWVCMAGVARQVWGVRAPCLCNPRSQLRRASLRRTTSLSETFGGWDGLRQIIVKFTSWPRYDDCRGVVSLSFGRRASVLSANSSLPGHHCK